MLRASYKRSFDRRGCKSGDDGILRYIIYLSIKHDIDPDELLDSFFEAEKKNIVICGPLKIVLRERTEDYVVFLVTRDLKLVAQMRFKSGLWEYPVKTKHLFSELVVHAQPLKSFKQPSSIIELQKGMKNVNLRVKVSEKSEVLQRYSRYTGDSLLLCVVMVTDSSGSIRLPLWNDQINAVSIGDEIDIKNAHVKMYKGLLQIVPTRKEGGLTIVNPSKPDDTELAS